MTTTPGLPLEVGIAEDGTCDLSFQALPGDSVLLIVTRNERRYAATFPVPTRLAFAHVAAMHELGVPVETPKVVSIAPPTP